MDDKKSGRCFGASNYLDGIAVLVPDEICFPAKKDAAGDKMDTERFLKGCDFDGWKNYSYELLQKVMQN